MSYTCNCPNKRPSLPMSMTALTFWVFMSRDVSQKDAGWYIFDPQIKGKSG
jgi:hypothetical protein